MARDTTRSLTPEEAKARLREAAGRVSVAGWTRSHPYNATLLALTAGLVAGGSRRFTEQVSVVLISALSGTLNGTRGRNT